MVEFTIDLTEDEFNKCNEFANESAKTQREWRSGGTQFRNLRLIQDDTWRGKVGEVVTKKFLEQEPFNIKGIELDFNVYPRGKWDEQDFTIGNITMSIKSAKWFANWLLLETKDIERGELYDYYVFVTISKNFKSGDIRGYATKDEINQQNSQTYRLQKGDLIPGTSTRLDASNYARHSKDLHNTEKDWEELVKSSK